LKLVFRGDVYDRVVHTAWVKLYSKILSIIVPIAVEYEMKNSERLSVQHQQRMKVRIESFNPPATTTDELSVADSSSHSTDSNLTSGRLAAVVSSH
jgi:hypothetical protein